MAEIKKRVISRKGSQKAADQFKFSSENKIPQFLQWET